VNDVNSRKIWVAIQTGGEFLEGKLPASPRHPKGRNPYAHLAKCIKSKYNTSYKELSDDKVDDVMVFIDYLVQNPF
jgi:hypothetical protein